MKKRLVVIDGKSVFYRGYYAMPNLSLNDGTPTGGVYGFASLALEIAKRLSPDYVCVAWDKPKTNIRKRREIYSDYKAGRKKAPDDFYAQIPILQKLLEAFSWPLYEYDDYEADDIMATLAKKASEEGIEVCLITSDLDALQAMVSPLVKVYLLKKGLSNIEQFEPSSFQEKYQLDVDQFLDLKSLMGDSSDNIPGVAGVGKKTATNLLQEYKTLDAIYDNLWKIKDSLRIKLEKDKDAAYLSKKVATLFFDAPVPLDLAAMDVNDVDSKALQKLLIELEFRSLLRSLPESMQDSSGAAERQLQDIVELSSRDAEALLLMSDKVVVVDTGDGLWLSHEEGKAAKVSYEKAEVILKNVPIIAHDTKAIMHTLLGNGYTRLPDVKHDIKQASFLLNPLRRSNDLVDLVGVESLDDKGTISAIWLLYNEHQLAFDNEPKIKKLAETIDFPLIAILARMEHKGVTLDTALLNEMSSTIAEKITVIQNDIYTMAGKEFNIASPSQLAEVLFNDIGLPTEGIKKGKTGYSTGQKELNKLRILHPIIEKVESFREFTKLKNTYIDTLPKLIDTNSRIHTTFNQDVTATGRLSSTDPNLQNIPIRTEMGRRIRDAFVPEKGNVFVSADYSQFELRLVAVMAGDQRMIDSFNANVDIHAKTYSDIYGIPIDNVTKEQRRAAKVINFGVLYGMSAHGLAVAAKMSILEAKHFIEQYFEARPKVKEYIDATIEKAKKDGYVETLLGRRRPTPDIHSSNYVVRESAKRAAANMPIQGTEADLMKIAMLRTEERLNGIGEQLLQVHDSILVECPRDKADQVSVIIKESMESVYPELGIQLNVDVSVGENWGEV